ncbi:MAG: SO_0444 family Cu/Zn efflux transporter [Rhodothermaceae bacterium]
MINVIIDILNESWLVFNEMAPYLLFGFLVAGILSVFISPEWVEKHLGGSGIGPVFKASIFGIPLPLCSCGVLPVAISFKKNGASKASTTSFLLSTPQTGIDSILVTYAILGPVIAIFRPISALFTGLVGGTLIKYLDKENVNETYKAECAGDCCETATPKNKFAEIFNHGFITLPKDIAVSLIVGTILAGAMSVLIPPASLTAYLGGGLLSIFILMAAGVPIYVCATASVPIAAGFMHMGASPGAALAFLIAGPATNAAAFAVLLNVLGKKSVLIYIFTVALSAILSGIVLDYIFAAGNIQVEAMNMHEHHGYLSLFWSILLLSVLGISYSTKFKKSKSDEIEENSNMSENMVVLKVSGMSCGHCSAGVEKGLKALEGVKDVKVSLEKGEAVIETENVDTQILIKTVTELGYEAQVK